MLFKEFIKILLINIFLKFDIYVQHIHYFIYIINYNMETVFCYIAFSGQREKLPIEDLFPNTYFVAVADEFVIFTREKKLVDHFACLTFAKLFGSHFHRSNEET